MDQVYRNPEPIIPISDTWLKSPAGQEVYRLTSLKIKYKVALQVKSGEAFAAKRVAKEVGGSASDGAEYLLHAIQSKINAAKVSLLEEFLNVERIGEDCTKFISLDRCALVVRENGLWQISCYSTTDLDKAISILHQSDAHEANETARKWVLEPR